MTTFTTIPCSLKKSARLTLAALSVVVLVGCGSTERTALTTEASAADVTESAATATVATDAVATTAAETTTTQPSPSGPPSTVPADTTPPSTLVPPSFQTTPPTATVTIPPTVAPTIPPPVTSPVSSDPIAAVDENGDAVIVGSDGTIMTVLYESLGPDEPQPEEGPVVTIAGIAVSDDQSTRIVGTCCEPSPGWLYTINSPYPTPEGGAFGHAPVISPDQTQLAKITFGAIDVSKLDHSVSNYVEFESGATVLDLEWAGNEHVVALVSSPTETGLHRYQVTTDGLVASGVVSLPGASALAGVHDGVVYAIGATATLSAHDVALGAPVPTRDIVLPVVPLSASMHDGELRWIDQERNLHIGDVIVPGKFIYVA